MDEYEGWNVNAEEYFKPLHVYKEDYGQLPHRYHISEEYIFAFDFLVQNFKYQSILVYR